MDVLTVTTAVSVTIIWHILAEEVQLDAHKQLNTPACVTLCTLNTRRFAKLTVARLETISGIIDLCRGMRVEFSFRSPDAARLLLFLFICLYTH